jgi:hypothetical protein
MTMAEFHARRRRQPAARWSHQPRGHTDRQLGRADLEGDSLTPAKSWLGMIVQESGEGQGACPGPVIA